MLYATGFMGNFFFERGIWILYLSSMGLSLFQIGILQSVLSATMFVMEMPTGVISDKIGRKRALLLGHIFLIFYFSVFLVSTDFWLFFLGHVFYGIGLSFISGTDQAMLYDSLKEQKLEHKYGKSIGYYNALVITALALSMAMGGFLSELSWNYVFVAGIVTQIIAMIINLFLKPPSIVESGDEGVSSIKDIVGEAKEFITFNGAFRFLVISISTFVAITSVFYMYGQELLNQQGMSVKNISLLFAGMAIIQAVVSILSPQLADRYSGKKVLIITFLTIGFLYLLIPINNIFLLVSFIIINCMFEAVGVVSSKIINDELNSKTRATLLSLISLLDSILMFLAFPLIGFLAGYADISLILTVIGVASIIISCFTLFKFYKIKTLHSNEKVKTNI
ncbi:major facilitator transporter [Pontibacillus litoralis JSM 072002]|uniref:Major facilitator transporter n=1 Tax=Pontibacillus litoralis JSM 072002 TaxID=1385512 RepID=A0A0A5FUY2_9BACI|nr:major facilitator transporter [Pontibacillus litoralis JSM 072002]